MQSIDRLSRQLDRTIFRALWSWAFSETLPWRHKKIPRTWLNKTFLDLNASDARACVVDIHKGSVTPWPKPSGLTAEAAHQYAIRRSMYLEFLESVVKKWLPDLSTTVALSVCDGWIEYMGAPIFTHHRPHGDCPRLPDPDFLMHDFYEENKFRDDTRYYQKDIHAIFIGSTTGSLITKDMVDSRGLARLNAADFFYDKPGSTFLLPKLVQYIDDEALQALKELPYCQGSEVGWEKQLKNRFIISMDGNGATCSRVAITLKSNSALLKYDSVFDLYYTRSLSPWRHYVPIARHTDVINVVDQERANPGQMSFIAREGKKFYNRYLTRKPVEIYTALLLSMYQDCIEED